MLAGECERASDCKPPMPWSERGWAPTRAKLEWPGPTCRALTCRTGHCSFVTDGDSSTSALRAISAYLYFSPCRRATFLSCTYAGNVCSTWRELDLGSLEAVGSQGLPLPALGPRRSGLPGTARVTGT